MKRPYVLLAAIAAALGLSGCDALINQQNFFEKFEPNLTDNYSAGMSDSDLLSSLSEDTDSNSFYDDLSADPTLTDTIVGQLDTIVTTSADPAEVEAAATYLSEIVLNTTEVGDVVNNLVGALINSDSSSGNTEADLMNSVLSPIESMIASGDQTDFNTFIANVTLLADTYTALASVDPSEVSADLAQAAAVVLVLDTVLTAIDVDGDGDMTDQTPQEQIDQLYLVLTDLQDGTLDTATLDFGSNTTDPDTGDPIFDFSLALIGDASTDTPIETLLAAAGLSNITDLISSMGN